uniref:Uncharacterized protein n=1 Tax=Globodera rostochiensis TaxID=31243 RepID=A0A914HI92_GLORO
MIRKKKKPSTEGEQFNCLLSKNAQLTAGLMHLFTCNFEEANSRRNIKNLGAGTNLHREYVNLLSSV